MYFSLDHSNPRQKVQRALLLIKQSRSYKRPDLFNEKLNNNAPSLGKLDKNSSSEDDADDNGLPFRSATRTTRHNKKPTGQCLGIHSGNEEN